MNSPIVLADYAKEGRFAFDPSSGMVRAELEEHTVAGFGQWRTFGFLRNRRKCFVAVFLRNDSLVLWVDREEYRLLGPDVRAEVKRAFITRRFVLCEGGKLLFERRYLFFQREVWPDDGDIFSVVTRIVGSRDQGRGFLHVWRARLEGRDLGSAEFLRELQDLVDPSFSPDDPPR